MYLWCSFRPLQHLDAQFIYVLQHFHMWLSRKVLLQSIGRAPSATPMPLTRTERWVMAFCSL